MLTAVLCPPSMAALRHALAHMDTALYEAVELRLDYCRDLDVDSLPMSPLPVIMTLRSPAQGGHFNASEEERLHLLERLLRHTPDYLDVEDDIAPEALRKLCNLAQGTTLLLSHHDFVRTPDLPDLLVSMTSLLPPKQGVLYKIACQAKTTLDALRMLVFCRRYHPKLQTQKSGLIGISMGEYGETTRILAPVVHHGIMYCPVAASTAPGQLDARHLDSLYNVRTLNSQTALYGLIGDPVQQSQGHIFHNARNRRDGVNAVYVKWHTPLENLAATLNALAALNVQGLSVTMPLKKAVLPFCTPVVLASGDFLPGYHSSGSSLPNGLSSGSFTPGLPSPADFSGNDLQGHLPGDLLGDLPSSNLSADKASANPSSATTPPADKPSANEYLPPFRPLAPAFHDAVNTLRLVSPTVNYNAATQADNSQHQNSLCATNKRKIRASGNGADDSNSTTCDNGTGSKNHANNMDDKIGRKNREHCSRVWEGTNTDGEGALRSLPFPMQGKTALLIGAGGAASALIAALHETGAHCLIYNRSPKNLPYGYTVQDISELFAPSLPRHDVIINTLPFTLDFPFERVPFVAGTLAFDISYAHESRFLQRAAAKGCQTLTGQDMFEEQALLQREFWGLPTTGKTVPC